MLFVYCDDYAFNCPNFEPYNSMSTCSSICKPSCALRRSTTSEVEATIIRGLSRLLANQRKMMQKLNEKQK